MATLKITDENFDTEVLKSSKPIVVDFWAEWCGPCKMLTPTIDELATKYDGNVVVGKLNVDHHPTIATEYGIRSIPSLLFFKEGKVQNQIMGAVSKEEIEAAIETLIK